MRAAAGIDRWKGGWIVAELRRDELHLWETGEIGPAVERLGKAAAVAIDMPIALATRGTRSAEADLRAALGASARSVFSSPTRHALDAATQAEATARNRARGGPGISAQAFGLFGSIREIRGALAGAAHDHWWETHPETAFALMNDGTPAASKRSALGVAQRLHLLRAHVPDTDRALLQAPAKVPIDDALDAIAAVWSADRIRRGTARVFGPPDRDNQGFALGVRI